MSYNHPYRKPQDDFSAHHDTYTDSQRMYHRESGAYGSRIRSTSPKQTQSALSSSLEELSALPPGKALSFLHSCGLDADDLKTLAELPEHLISAEKLPELLSEIKKKKVTNTSSSRSSMLQHSSSGHSWEDRRPTQLVEYPLDLPVRQSYSHHREQGQTLEDRWGNVQPSCSPTHAYTSSESGYVVEYNHLKEKNACFDKPSCATESSRQKTAVVSQSYSNYSRDVHPSYLSSREAGQPSHLSSRDVGQPSHLSSRDSGQSSHLSSRNVGQPSHLSSRDIGQLSHLSGRNVGQPSQLSSRNVGQPSQLSSRTVGQTSHLSSRDVGQPSHLLSRNIGQPPQLSSRNVGLPSQLSSRDVGQPSHLLSRNVGQPSQLTSRNVGLPSQLSSRNVGQPSQLSSRNVGQPSQLSSRNIGQPSQLSSRDIGQPSQLSSRDISQPSYLSSRDFDQSSHLSSRDINYSSYQSSRNISLPSLLSSRVVGQPSHHRRAKAHRVPTRKEASDFHGKTPPVFPYACVLCEITVLSNKDWSVHIQGPQHANSQLSLVERYPEWDQKMQSARRNTPTSEKPQSRTTQERGETSSSKNGSSSSRSGLSSSKNSRNLNETNKKERSKMVYVKFEMVEVDEAYLRQLLGQFGAITKLIMFSRMAFVEMGSTDQAEDIIKYFLHNPLRVKGHLLEFSLSASCSFSQSSCVVSFTPLPAGDGVHSELIAIAKRFGSVKHSLFLPSRGFVEMSNAQEAKQLVEHYSNSSLKLKGKTIQVNFSTEYQLIGDKDADREKLSISRSSHRKRSLSPRRRSYGSRRDSPSPKRRASVGTSRSRRSSDSKKRDEHRRSKDGSRENSSKQDSSSRSRSRKSPSKNQSKQTNETAEEKTLKDQSDAACDDSDLEGVAVIADDCEELNLEGEEFIEIDQEDQPDDEEQDYSTALTEDMQDILDDDETLSDLDVINIHSENSESILKDTISDESGECKVAQALQHNQEAAEEKTVDISDGSSECKEAQELQQNQELQKDKTEETLDGPSECKETQEMKKDKTADILDGSSECKEAQQLQENQEVKKDETSSDISDGSSECKNAKELKQNQEGPIVKTEDISDGSSECKEAQELQENQEVKKDETSSDISDGSSECKNAKELKQNQEGPIVKTEDISDRSSECKEAQELQENQEVKNDETSSDISDGSSECKEAQELQENPEGPIDKTEDISDGSSERKEAQELQENQEGPIDKTEDISDGSSERKEAQELQENKEALTDESVAMSDGSSENNQQMEQNQEMQEDKTEEILGGPSECKDDKEIQQNQEVQKDETEAMEQEASDFPVNLENCITLDEFTEEMTEQGNKQESSTPSTEEMYGRVLEVKGFPLAKKYTEDDLLNIGKKCGEVAGCCLVRSNRKVDKALIEMVNAADASKLEVECKRQNFKLGGKVLRITVSNKYSRVKERVSVESDSGKAQIKKPVEEMNEEVSQSVTSCEEISGKPAETEIPEECAEAQKETNPDTIMQTSSDEEEEAYGKVLRIRNLPSTDEYTDADFVSIAERYGKVRRHWLFRPRHTGLIEMENASDAGKVVAAANVNEIVIAGKHPLITVSMKHSHLNKSYFLHGSSDCSESKTQNQETSDDNQAVNSKNVKQQSAPDDGTGTTIEDSGSVTETQVQLKDAVGTEFVRPVVGYFCSLCNVIYASEEEAKEEHCRTVSHHQKHKERMEQNGSK